MYNPARKSLAARLDRDFDIEFEVEDGAGAPFDFTGYAGKMEVREAQSIAAPLIVEAVVTLELGWLRASIAKGSVPLTETITGWFDIAITDPGGKTYNWVEGPFTFSGVATDA